VPVLPYTSSKLSAGALPIRNHSGAMRTRRE
jgi:hypothetical protein